ncbi:MAG TPA: glycosyltransferase family 4 protein [Chlamydiales bacterium]|nr:glycosyltransferase family 4 protein [Chlamydiales bacterium]
MLSILHLESSPGWGGQEIRILKESEGLIARGHKVVLAPQKGGGLAKYALEKGLIVYEIDYSKKRLLPCLWEIYRILKKEKINIINTHSSIDSWFGGTLARLMRIPIVRTRHLSTEVRVGLNSRLLYHLLTDYVVTTCEAVIPKLSSQSGKPLSYFSSIPTGVDVEKIIVNPQEQEAFRTSLQVMPNELLVGTACFMRSWKGIEDFLQAACLSRGLGIKWVIIGGGHSERYVQRSKELSLDGVVHFTGHLENPMPAIAALDVFVLLSTAHEGVSQSSLQAAYLKKPLIMTPTGGNSEVCLDQVTGIQVPIFSPQKVLEAVLTMKESPEKRKQWGESAHKLVLEKFTLNSMLDSMEKIFINVGGYGRK